MLVVYPAGRWYAGVQPQDADELVAVEVVGNEPLERLLYKAPTGDNKDLSRYPPELVAEVQSSKKDS
jgi:(2Fe-2S) ferredoxin